MIGALVAFLFKLSKPFFLMIVDVFNKGALRKVAAYTTILALFVGLYAAVMALIAVIKVACPDFISIPFSWVIPDNFSLCVTTYITAGMLISIYRWKKNGIQMTLGF